MWKRYIRSLLLITSVTLLQDGAGYGAWNPLRDPALLGWWSCDEGTGGVVADSSPNGNDGVFINGSPAWTRCNNRNAQVDIRFLDTKTGQPGDRPWRMRYPINSSIARWNGEWNRLLMPLRQFSEHGAWDEERWWPPIGAFDWKAVEWFEIVAEYYSLQGIHFCFDTIRVIPPGAPG